MALSTTELELVARTARQLAFDAPRVTIEAFYAASLGMNAASQLAAFPDPDPTGQLAIATAHLTQAREEILQVNCDIPSYVVYDDPHLVASIAGLGTYLTEKGLAPEVVGRFAHRDSIRSRLRRLTQGHHLEAVGAALMASACSFGRGTRGSGDQGLDALGWKELIEVDTAFSNGTVVLDNDGVGEKVFLLASSKAALSARANATPLLNPAHIRELVGGWVIQRSPAGMWRNLGIKMLSPLQMILITTYRLSADAKALCRELGVQVWGIPELIYLICLHAPNTVFDAAHPYRVDSTGFRRWWNDALSQRIAPPTGP